MTDQATLFGPSPAMAPKLKAKALPKVERKPTPSAPATAAQRGRIQATIASQRSKASVGDLVMAAECRRCGAEMVAEIVAIEPEGGRTLEARCLQCSRD